MAKRIGKYKVSNKESELSLVDGGTTTGKTVFSQPVMATEALTGAVYSPYVPLIMTPLVYDPSDFTPRKGVMTRYAKKMIRPEFYGKIAVKDINLI